MFSYTVERQNLYDLVSHHVPNFKQLPLYKQENILLFGIPGHEEDVNATNIALTKIVQNYILQTLNTIPIPIVSIMYCIVLIL